ncbi:sugar transferase (plasmid) [Pseudohalocynthiibacter aestuariivivens]|nr:sugar transferase [Pseudohalocynthiibacter aestuariivivens]
MLLVLAPLLLPLGLGVAGVLALQGAPVLHAQWRVGRHGRMFRLWKFRTMHPGAEAALPVFLAENGRMAHLWRRHRKLPDDPRVTSLGRLLRRYSLDELPQLWNVLIGEMSLVGPRPVPWDELYAHYGTAMPGYLSCRPGLSGLWQVSGRNRLPYAQRVELDCYYVRNHSLGLDLVIILRTVGSVLCGTGC